MTLQGILPVSELNIIVQIHRVYYVEINII